MIKKSLFIGSLVAVLLLSFTALAEASIFTVWADSNSDGIKDLYLGDITSYDGAIGANANYNYFSASGHPVNGPNPHRNRLKIFIYERTTNGRHFLNMIAGRDNGGTQHSYDLDILVSGSLGNPREIRGDEGRELTETSPNVFRGDWRFRNNSDGGVIGPLRGPWEVRITPGDSTLNRHVINSNGTSNIRIDTLGYDHYFISTAPVPEPATMVLLSSGLLGGAFVRRRRS